MKRGLLPQVIGLARPRLGAGVDGLFSDHLDTTLLVRDAWAADQLSPEVAAAPGPG